MREAVEEISEAAAQGVVAVTFGVMIDADDNEDDTDTVDDDEDDDTDDDD